MGYLGGPVKSLMEKPEVGNLLLVSLISYLGEALVLCEITAVSKNI